MQYLKTSSFLLVCIFALTHFLLLPVSVHADSRKQIRTSYDQNGDGLTDLWKIQHEGANFPFKVILDKEQNGFEETLLFYDENTGMLQEQAQDTNRDLHINQWAYFKNNQEHPFLIKTDTTHDGLVDSWAFYNVSGQLIRHGLDTNANQQMDKIFYYAPDSSKLFPKRMEEDRNEDGQMDYLEYYDSKGKVERVQEEK